MRSSLFAALPLVALALAGPARPRSAFRQATPTPARPRSARRATSGRRAPRPTCRRCSMRMPGSAPRRSTSARPAQVRAGPTPADAVKAVMAARGMSTAPDPSVVTRELAYGRNAWQKARIYRPAGPARGSRPLIVYYHGGGWVIADLDIYDAAPRMLAKQLGAVVVSVEYRHAPEFKFPAQHDDAVNAYRWVLSNARALGRRRQPHGVRRRKRGRQPCHRHRDRGARQPPADAAPHPVGLSDRRFADEPAVALDRRQCQAAQHPRPAVVRLLLQPPPERRAGPAHQPRPRQSARASAGDDRQCARSIRCCRTGST